MRSKEREKKIRIPPNHTVKIRGPLLEILEHPAVQRLRYIGQLGLDVPVVYPGAFESRLVHSIDTYRISNLMTTHLVEDEWLSKDEKKHVDAAAFIHDIEHLCGSHNLDSFEEFGSHNTRTKNMRNYDLL